MIAIISNDRAHERTASIWGRRSAVIQRHIMYESRKRQRPPVRAAGVYVNNTRSPNCAEKYTRPSLVAQAGVAICRRILSGAIDYAQARRETAALTAAVDVLVRLRDKHERSALTNDLFAPCEV